MTTRSLVIAFLGAAVVSAGVGGYVALRRNAAEAPASATLPSVAQDIEPGAGPGATMEPASLTTVSVPPAQPADRPSVPPAQVTPPATQTGSTASRVETSRGTAAPMARRGRASSADPAAAQTPAPIETVMRPALAPPPLPAATQAPPPVETPPPPPPDIDVPVQEPPRPRFEELTIKADSVVGIRLETGVSSETARVEDRVTARVTRDVLVDGRTALPANARIEGVVTNVEQGGKFRERARLGIRFTTLVLADGTRTSIRTDTIFRDGESPAADATSKVGASAVVGAILGAVVGGKKGAVIGGTAGAAGGTAAVMSGGRRAASFAAGAPLTLKLTEPLTVLVEREQWREER